MHVVGLESEYYDMQEILWLAMSKSIIKYLYLLILLKKAEKLICMLFHIFYVSGILS